VLALATYPAAATAAAGTAVAWLVRRGHATPVAIAALFTVADHLRSFVATGFPWSLLGYTQVADGTLLPLAATGGVYLVGFTVALAGALIAAAIRGLAGRPGWQRGVPIGAALWVVLFGVGALGPTGTGGAPAAGPTVRVAALQGSFDQGRKWSPALHERTLSVYETLTRSAAGAGAELIVWPETAVPGPIEADPSTAYRIARLARETGTTLVVGAVGIERAPADGSVSDWYDSAFLVEPDGGWAGRYDKSHLVPFGEYVPLRSALGGLFEAVARGIAPVDVSAGPGPMALRAYVPGRGSGRGGAVRLGVPICYELLFPDRVRRFVDDGAELLVAITNDAWYGRTGAPHQFLAITAMRSAETGVALVRAANTGVSAIVEAGGRVVEQSGLFERGYVVGDVRLGERARATFYVRHGDVFAWGCWAGLAIRGVLARRERPREPVRSGQPGSRGATGAEGRAGAVGRT